MKRLLFTREITPLQISNFNLPDLKIDPKAFIRVEFVDFNYSKETKYALFTSKNAVKALVDNSYIKLLTNTICIAVGDKTAKELHKYGLKTIIPKNSCAEGLVELFKEHPHINGISYFCGEKRRSLIEDFFDSFKYDYHSIVVYKTVEVEVLLDPYSYDGIAFASPSAVYAFFRQYPGVKLPCFAIGDTTADALKYYTDSIMVAQKPSIKHLALCAYDFFENKH